ncbi:transmembrane amino acid transporter protein-domain-containing protein [Sparassis latifolia]
MAAGLLEVSSLPSRFSPDRIMASAAYPDLPATKTKDEESQTDAHSTVDDTTSYKELVAEEYDHAIKYRTCSWEKTAALLFSEYICLAITSFPWSYSVLGLVPGIILTIVVAGIVQYTSLVLWRFCLKHPDVRDACDIGKLLLGGSQLAYNVTAVFFFLNNTFIQALHVLVGAELLNTLTNSPVCTIVYSVVTVVVCFVVTLPRTLNQLSSLGTFSALFMGIAILLCIIFAGVQDHPFGFIAGQNPIVTAIPIKGTSFVSGMSAFLNITYTLVGQIVLPSFIAEMKDPNEFPKALWAVTISEVIVYILCGALVYHWTGNQYVTAPAFGALQPVLKKIAFSFAIPTIIFLGALYSSITSRFIFFRIFRNSHHRHSNTFIGWSAWAGIIAATWIVAFVIAEVIPFFSDMLSLMSSLFDSWFGFIFWGMAYLRMHPGPKRWAGPWRSLETLVNYFLILLGAYIFVAGTYTSIKSIVDSYQQRLFGSAFSCASNAI